MTTIISGTNRSGSSTLKVAQYYQRQLLEKSFETNLLSLMQLPENLLNSDLYGKRSPEFQVIQDMVTVTNKFLFVIPEYNGSFPGALKLFIDACDFPGSFYEKKVALVGVSSGKYGNVRGIEHFTGVCGYLHMHVMPLRIHIGSVKQELDADNNFFLPDTVKFTNEQIDKFIKF